MNFKDKYTNAIEKDSKKVEISNDAYAIGEAVDQLCNNLEKLRLTF